MMVCLMLTCKLSCEDPDGLWEWQGMPIVLAGSRRLHKDRYKFETSLGYKANPRLARATQRNIKFKLIWGW